MDRLRPPATFTDRIRNNWHKIAGLTGAVLLVAACQQGDSADSADSASTSEQTTSTVQTGPICRWFDRDGERQPLVREAPPTVRVAGECNKPYDQTWIGMYAVAAFDSAQVVATPFNGEEIEVICVTPGQRTGDESGDPGNISTTWVRGVYDGIEGLVSEVNVGFVRDEDFEVCPGPPQAAPSTLRQAA